MSSRAPIFIVGNDRSGTTMLRLILDRNPALAVPTESMIITDFQDELESQDQFQSNTDRLRRLLVKIWNHPKIRLWGLTDRPPEQLPEGVNREQEFRWAIESVFESYARQKSAARWGDKTPSYLYNIDLLLRLWPDARVVIVVRDGRDVALSIIPLPFGANNVWAAATDWQRGIQAGQKAKREHPGQVMEIRYEDLVESPRSKVEELCEFTGLRYSEDMLAIEQTDPSNLVASQIGWFEQVGAGITTARVGRWKSEMNLDEQRVFAGVAGRTLADMGYEVKTAESPIAPLREFSFKATNSIRRAINLVKLRVFQERGRELRYVLRRRMRS